MKSLYGQGGRTGTKLKIEAMSEMYGARQLLGKDLGSFGVLPSRMQIKDQRDKVDSPGISAGTYLGSHRRVDSSLFYHLRLNHTQQDAGYLTNQTTYHWLSAYVGTILTESTNRRGKYLLHPIQYTVTSTDVICNPVMMGMLYTNTLWHLYKGFEPVLICLSAGIFGTNLHWSQRTFVKPTWP